MDKAARSECQFCVHNALGFGRPSSLSPFSCFRVSQLVSILALLESFIEIIKDELDNDT
jgi:hypothetical protein